MLFIGSRVEIPAYTGVWMMGDRYGTCVKFYHGYVHVDMDTSGRTYRFPESELKDVS